MKTAAQMRKIADKPEDRVNKSCEEMLEIISLRMERVAGIHGHNVSMWFSLPGDNAHMAKPCKYGIWDSHPVTREVLREVERALIDKGYIVECHTTKYDRYNAGLRITMEIYWDV